MNSARSHWEGELDVDAITLPEGESGRGREVLTAERLDRLAVYFSAPPQVRAHWGGPKDVTELARDVGCRVKSVEAWKKHPKMLDRVRELIEVNAVYAMPAILYGQMILATPEVIPLEDGSFIVRGGDTKAANFVATMAKYMRQGGGGAGMTQNNFNMRDDPGAHMTDDQLQGAIVAAAKKILSGEVDLGEENDAGTG